MAEPLGRAGFTRGREQGREQEQESKYSEIYDVKTLEELVALLQRWLSGGVLDQETAAWFYDQYASRLPEYAKYAPLMDEISRSPYLTEEDRQEVSHLPFFDQIQVLYNRTQAAELEAQQRSVGEGQAAEALLAGLTRREPEGLEMPLIPAETKVAKQFLEETQLAPGTKLRSFIASQIPGIAQETRGARAEWWRRLQEPEEEPTLESEQARRRAGMAKWARIGEVAPTAEVAGGVYYGPGGLRAIAERAYQGAQASLAGLRPEDFPKGMPEPYTGEDPFLKALRRKKFMPEYYRQPGAGLARALTPAVRF